MGDADRFCTDTFSQRPSAADSGDPNQAAWELPLPFVDSTGSRFPTDALPEPVCYFVTAQSIALQVPEDLVGCLVLGAGAAAAARRCVVRLNSDWAEPLNIFIVIALPSGERKSPGFKAANAPLEDRERELALEAEPQIAMAQTQADILQKRVQDLKNSAAKAKSDGERENLTKDASELATKLASMSVPVSPRLLADDATSEAVASLLAQQDGRLAVMSTEGGLFETMAGRYSEGVVNFDVHLKGFSGDTLRVDRKSRPPEYVPQPALTLCLTVQPDVIRGLAGKRGFRGRGLLARFLYSHPRSLVGYRSTTPPPVPDELRQGWDQMLRDILKIPDPTKGQEHAIRLSPDAFESFQAFRNKVEAQLRPGADLYEIQDWGNKLCEAVARMAGVIHLFRHHGDARPWEIQMASSTIEAAICLGEYFSGHANVAFGMMGADPRMEKAWRLWASIRHDGHETFTRRDLWQRVRRGFTVDELADVLGLLVRMGYIRQVSTAQATGRGRPASPTFEVNPLGRSQGGHSPTNSGYCGDSGYTPPEPGTGQEEHPTWSDEGLNNLTDPRTQNTHNTQYSPTEHEVSGSAFGYPELDHEPEGDWGEV